MQLRHLNFVISTSFGCYYDLRHDFILFSVMTLCVTTTNDYDSCRYIIVSLHGYIVRATSSNCYQAQAKSSSRIHIFRLEYRFVLLSVVFFEAYEKRSHLKRFISVSVKIAEDESSMILGDIIWIRRTNNLIFECDGISHRCETW